ncbi:MAG: DUF4393 domain-containing protein [Pseudonocardiaceae bacterium]
MAESAEDMPERTGLPVPASRGEDLDLINGATGLVRVAATTWWRAMNAVVDTATHTGAKIVKSAASGASPTELLDETASEFRSFAQRALGLDDGGDAHTAALEAPRRSCSEQELRRRGAALLYRSADVTYNEDMHPAYERILTEIAPDEARILRHLAINGAQATLDVRTTRPFGVGSELVAERLSMIGIESGCRHLDRTLAYLNNLFRLGLVWFSKEKVDPGKYQVLEVQPEAVEAMKGAGRSATTVYRSVHLTPFGEDFCRICLPLDEPGFSAPAENETKPN